jgi:Winged helix-turn helix
MCDGREWPLPSEAPKGFSWHQNQGLDDALLHRIGWSVQVPRRRPTEKVEAAIGDLRLVVLLRMVLYWQA